MPKETVYWTTKNGTKIDIDLMTIDHLRNALKMTVKAIKKKKNHAKSFCDATEIDLY